MFQLNFYCYDKILTKTPRKEMVNLVYTFPSLFLIERSRAVN